MILSLQDNVASRQDLKALILEVRAYAKWYAQAAVKTRLVHGHTPVPPEFSEVAVKLINAWDKEHPVNQASLDELLRMLEDFEATAPHISITLAAAPPASLRKQLVAWCREHVAPNALVDIHFNATLLGGMVVRYGSHVYDWSFKRQIMANRGKFPEILRNV